MATALPDEMTSVGDESSDELSSAASTGSEEQCSEGDGVYSDCDAKPGEDPIRHYRMQLFRAFNNVLSAAYEQTACVYFCLKPSYKISVALRKHGRALRNALHQLDRLLPTTHARGIYDMPSADDLRDAVPPLTRDVMNRRRRVMARLYPEIAKAQDDEWEAREACWDYCPDGWESKAVALAVACDHLSDNLVAAAYNAHPMLTSLASFVMPRFESRDNDDSSAFAFDECVPGLAADLHTFGQTASALERAIERVYEHSDGSVSDSGARRQLF